MVVNWLYGVAHQTALKARAGAARRKERERQVVEMPEPAVEGQEAWHDLRPLLEQELSRLPDKYRVPIVLCGLEGKTRGEAARQLGWPEGTVAGRLTTARKMLARRLARRGVALPGGTLAAVLSRNMASASVPASVVSSTIKTASLFAAGQAAGTGVISAKVAALTEGVLKTMLLTKLKVVMVLCVIAGLTGAAGLIYQTQAAEQPKAQQANERPNAPKTEESDKEKQPKEDKDKLQGTWQLVTSENDGLRVGEGRPEIKDSRVVIEKSAVTLSGKAFHSPNVPLPAEDIKIIGVLTLDAKKNPKEITLTWDKDPRSIIKDFEWRGIYVMDGDSLKICLSLDENAKTIPTEFSARFGSKRWLLIFRRGPAPEKKEEKKP